MVRLIFFKELVNDLIWIFGLDVSVRQLPLVFLIFFKFFNCDSKNAKPVEMSSQFKNTI